MSSSASSGGILSELYNFEIPQISDEIGLARKILESTATSSELSLTNENLHLNPYQAALKFKLPRFQAGEWFNYSNAVAKSQLDARFKDLLDSINFDLELMKKLFAQKQQVEESREISLFLIGSYNKISSFTQLISESKGIKAVGTDKTLIWTAFCDDPYNQNQLNNEYHEYNKYRSFGKSAWLVGMDNTGILSIDNYNWFLQLYSKNDLNKKAFSYYTGFNTIEPDYSRERFLDDYKGVMISYATVKTGGVSMFLLLWPLNGYSSGILGLIAFLYERVTYIRRNDKGDDDPAIYVYGIHKKEHKNDVMDLIFNLNNFEKVISSFSEAGAKGFNEFFNEHAYKMRKHMKNLKKRWLN